MGTVGTYGFRVIRWGLSWCRMLTTWSHLFIGAVDHMGERLLAQAMRHAGWRPVRHLRVVKRNGQTKLLWRK